MSELGEKMNKFNLDGLLSNQPLFKHISPFELDSLKKEVVKLKVDKNFTLFQKNDEADACYILVYGLIKLAIPNDNGNDKIIELIRPGQSIGEAMIFLDEVYPFYAEALENSLLLKVPKKALFKLLEQSPAIAKQMMAGLSYRVLGFIRNIERQTSHSALQRVIDYLLQTSKYQGSNEIHLELKKNVVASLLNLTPETFSRMLHHLSEMRLIEVSSSHIRIMSEDLLRNFRLREGLKEAA
jgi:CRP-like cAMP-binding protein